VSPPCFVFTYRSPSSVPGYATNAFMLGGFDNVAPYLAATENYLFATPGTKGTTPANLSAALYENTASGYSTNIWTFGGYNAGGVQSIVENYIVATPGTKGTAPSALSPGKQGPVAMGTNTVSLVVGGYTTVAVTSGEQYIYATPGSKGTTPANLVTARYAASGASNATTGFIFGGSPTGGYAAAVNTAESYVFGTPGTLGATPAALASTSILSGAAANTTSALVFLGQDSSNTYLSTVEQYLFATPGTKGTAPPALATALKGVGAAASNTLAFALGGATQGAASYVTFGETYQFASLGTKGTTPAALSSGKGYVAGASNRSL
jgi:hypothetical protein